jgi:hypothetical protein
MHEFQRSQLLTDPGSQEEVSDGCKKREPALRTTAEKKRSISGVMTDDDLLSKLLISRADRILANDN